MQKAAAARLTQRAEVQPPKLANAARPTRRQPASPVVPADVQDVTATQDNAGIVTNEREVDMTDAAETTALNE